MANVFNKIQLQRPESSVFDLSYDHKLSLKMGKLVPVHIQETIPGDKFSISSEAMFRMMPMIAPIMHKVDIYIHHFFVPNRLIWDNWETFITGGSRTGGAVPIVTPFPVLDMDVLANVTASTLPDYLGVPLGNYTGWNGLQQLSALPFAAYQRIWQDYYRDENLQYPNELPIKVNDGVQINTSQLITLQDRCWEHDYFTSCLPFAQKGDAIAMPIDLSGRAPIEFSQDPSHNYQIVRDGATFLNAGAGDLQYNISRVTDGSGIEKVIDLANTHHVDLGNATLENVTTINDLRSAFSLQKWLEKNARGGTRYTETILAHFGVRSSDKRLQRPEYLGGSRASMAISEVLQTSESSTETPQGTMAGHGIGVATGNHATYYCEEHGYIIGILSIRPKTSYYQGLPKHFFKTDKLDYYWPDFAHLGEQEVLVKELVFNHAAGPGNSNDQVFGYIPRYSEYRYNSGRVSGQMRDTLDYWHMGRDIPLFPTLDEAFVACNPTKRIFAVTDDTEDEIVGHIFHKIRAKRNIPMYGNPGGL